MANGHRGRVKESIVESDTRLMDTNGARLLQARIRAGVRVGTRIELVRDAAGESGLRAGDCGIVDGIDDKGQVLVLWDRGFTLGIDPDSTPFRPLAA